MSCSLKSMCGPLGGHRSLPHFRSPDESSCAFSNIPRGLFLGLTACLQVNCLKARETGLDSELWRRKPDRRPLQEIKDRALKND